MFSTVVIFHFILIFCGIKSLEVVPERVQVDYYNPKYIRYFNMTVRKASRHSPYALNIDFDAKFGFGNNLLFDCILYEHLSGQFKPTLLQVTYKFCDFLYGDPLLGQLIVPQLPKNESCPFKAGEHHFNNIILNVKDNFPFVLPFTWASVMVKTRDDINGYIMKDNKKVPVLNVKIFVTIIQKPKKS